MSHKQTKKKNDSKNVANKKKEKVVYYDDNSTIFDMSGVRGGRGSRGNSSNNRENRANADRGNRAYTQPKRRSTAKEKWKTYVSAVKMMFPWMCIALIAIGVLYFIVVFLYHCAA